MVLLASYRTGSPAESLPGGAVQVAVTALTATGDTSPVQASAEGVLVCVGLGLLYTTIGVVVVDRFLRAARARAVLSLT